MNNRSGMTFIEIFVVVVIGTFFMGVVYKAWNRGMFFVNRGSHYVQMQRGVRFIFEYLEDDLDQAAFYRKDAPYSFTIRKNYLEMVKYGPKNESEGRPLLHKVIYEMTDKGELDRTEYDDKAKIISTRKFGTDFVKMEFEHYQLPLALGTQSNRHFLRLWLQARYESDSPLIKEKEQVLDAITSFSLKTPNSQFRDYYYLHNPVSVRDKP
ncbi:MAG: prepilin-type N-terminal cleavage/methylation domain-containing protein [Candidatus Wallbacteria bacterium]|nr:prepilin-type N-terminal cleavage/methylation domain-containing protein [Candidatus Wallbacteria bacterium]